MTVQDPDTPALFQMFAPLDPATEAALRASIERHGVLVPVAVDQHGRVIDGYHRSRIADDLGVAFETRTHHVDDDDHGRELARTLNAVRRHLDPEQRRAIVAELRSAGHGLRPIADALGVSKSQIDRDAGELSRAGQLTVPDRVVGRDGKSRPARRPAREVEPGDVVADDYGDARLIDHVEAVGDDVILHDDDGDAIIAHGDHELDVAIIAHGDHELDVADVEPAGEGPEGDKTTSDAPTGGPSPVPERAGPPVSKPDVGGGVSHPARYSAPLMPVLQAEVPTDRYPVVLDPFAGTGRIHQLDNRTVGIEIEPEWARLHPDTILGSALALPFPSHIFDAVVTSPTYGNRLADSHNASDPELRRSYTHDLGRRLHTDNSGAMQWGPTYREFHEQAWAEAWRVIRPGGRLVVNVKDHVRGGARQPVTGWHLTTLARIGFEVRWFSDVATANLRQGENADLRLVEQVLVLDKPGGGR